MDQINSVRISYSEHGIIAAKVEEKVPLDQVQTLLLSEPPQLEHLPLPQKGFRNERPQNP
jgi:hypothetical protein